MDKEKVAWISLLFAGLLEIIWATTMKLSEGFTVLGPTLWTIVLLVVSFGLLAKAFRVLPAGTGYAVFTGIGAVGTVIVGALLFDEALSGWKLLLVMTLIIGIIGLKQVTGGEEA
ncbi:multidrug efflux SMR transporter [Exiguobacterium sp. AT1b]|uniref:DMT family transporter n=1 Tax=Exiguobacterium sp. (strain ATCC BAA-1283 / AT1b) TaxID=360911 RepID=UPI00093D4131|nr:multidrug efflux SMR transporter [Exiguobacterium sp. AT1b]